MSCLCDARARVCVCVSCSAKSSVASDATKALNPAIHIQALQNRVSPETEGVFNDNFWGKLDVVSDMCVFVCASNCIIAERSECGTSTRACGASAVIHAHCCVTQALYGRAAYLASANLRQLYVCGLTW